MKLSNVNTTDIKAAIELGCRTMSNVFNADDNDIPFFGSEVLPNPRLSFSNVHSESHVPGRHLNALLERRRRGGRLDFGGGGRKTRRGGLLFLLRPRAIAHEPRPRGRANRELQRSQRA